jgi:hypothetical protein
MAQRKPPPKSYQIEIDALARQTASLPPKERWEVAHHLLAIIKVLNVLWDRLRGVKASAGRQHNSQKDKPKRSVRRPPAGSQ